MNRKTLIISGAIIVLAIIIFIASALIKKPTGTTTPTPVEQTTPATTNTNANTNTTAFPLDDTKIAALTAQASKEYDFALSKAKEWKSDCVPVAATIKYIGPINDANGKDTYIFESPSLNLYYFALTFDQAVNASGQNNFQRVLYFKQDYFLPTNTQVLPVSYYKLTYLDALKKADDLGGKNIRAENKAYDVNLVLSAQSGGLLMWDVEYIVNGATMFSVSINAFDGTVK